MRAINLCLLFLVTPLFAAKMLDIYFIDAEVGNAILVVTPSGQAMMLDTGQPGQAFVDRALKIIDLAGGSGRSLRTARASARLLNSR